MKKTRQFDDIKNGELIRFLVEPPPYQKEKKYWNFGIVHNDYMKNFFSITVPGRWTGFETFRIRRDGMDKSGKGAKQIAFRLSPQEVENNALVQRIIKIHEQIKNLEKEIRVLNEKVMRGETVIFPEHPLPES